MLSSQKLFLILALSFFFCLNSHAQLNVDSLNIHDYHVHVFSENWMNTNVKQHQVLKKSGFQVLKDFKDYSNIDTILESNQNASMLLISAGYAYKNKDATSLRRLVEQENNMLAELVSKYPDKVIGFYGINPFTDFCYEEILRCKNELKLHGIKLHFQGNGINLFDPKANEVVTNLFAFLDQHNIPIIIHNNGADMNSGLQYAQFFIDSILRKSESLDIIFAHSGGSGGFNDFTRDFLSAMNKYLSENQNNGHHIFFELSGVVLSFDYPGKLPTQDLGKVMQEIGYEHFLFGTDYPFRDAATYIEHLEKELQLNEPELKKIVERNIFSLLKN